MTIYNIPDHLRGDTWDGLTFTLSSNGVTASLTAVSSVVAEFRQDIDSPVALTLTTTNSSILIVEPLSGIIQFTPQIIEIPFQTYVYDIQVNYTSGAKKTYTKGTWKILPDITQ
tara:strand:- start:1378 stop:1719 length:342 start_codon:yes stop_codon:yes gene_type:complete